MAPQPYQLVMKAGPAPGRKFLLEKDEIHIGRDVSNDIVVNDAEVSRRHARLTMRTGGYVLEDLGSTNGTFINGQRVIGPRQLQPGETIILGENVTFSFETPAPDPDATFVEARPEMGPPPTVAVYPPAAPSPPSPASGAAYTPAEARQPLASEPVFSGYVSPSAEEPMAPPEVKRRTNRWVWASCGCLAVLFCVAVAATLWYIDTNFLWCQLFPFLAGC